MKEEEALKLRTISIILIVALLAVCISGCGGSTPASENESVQASESAASATEDAGAEAAPQDEALPEDSAAEPEEEPAVENMLPDNYPMLCEDGSVTLSVIANLNGNLSDLVDDYSQIPWWQEVSTRTGLQFTWQMVNFINQSEQFNLLVAANSLPNLVCIANTYTGSITSAVEEDIFVDLAPYLDEYLPDYKKVIARDDIRPSVYDLNGSVVYFHELQVLDTTKPVPNNGVFMRGDFMDAQGLEVPITYDEYEEVLLKLKDAYNLEAPIYLGGLNTQWLSAGLNVKNAVSLDADGNVIYGPIEDAYREYLEIMNKWYSEGLIYKDFYAEDTGNMIVDMINFMGSGKSALTFGYCEFAGAISISDPNGYFTAGYIPRKNADDEVHLTEGIDPLISTNRWAIGPNSTEEEVQDICMMMNYFYTDEGSVLCNYGIEGESFEYQEDGTPWYTELITDNPDGLTLTQALVFYTGYMVPCAGTRMQYNIATYTTWADFVEVWSSADNDYAMPDVTLTPDESYEYSKIANDVTSYMDEVLAKFIIGEKDPGNDAEWNEYIDTMKSLGAETIVDIYSAALERYRSV